MLSHYFLKLLLQNQTAFLKHAVQLIKQFYRTFSLYGFDPNLCWWKMFLSLDYKHTQKNPQKYNSKSPFANRISIHKPEHMV